MIWIHFAHAASPEIAPITEEKRPEVDFVLIWADAKVMRSNDGGGAVQVAPFAKREPGNWVLARVLDRNPEAGVVHVSFAPRSNLAEHCVASTVTSAAVDIEGWVFETDLQPVVGQAYTVTTGEAESTVDVLHVRPGTPLVDGRPWMPMLHLPSPPPEGTPTGLYYRPDARSVPNTGAAGWVAPGASALLGEETVTFQAPPFGPGQIMVASYDDASKMVGLEGPCGTATLKVDTAPRNDGYATTPRDRSRGGRPHWYVDSGTAVVWEDGTPAGRLTRKRGWSKELTTGPLRCWTEPVGLHVSSMHVWRLCVPKEKVVER